MGGAKAPSVLDLLLFHRQEREFFNRLVHRLGQCHGAMQWVMALWLWFESVGHHDFIRHVSSAADGVVLRFLSEAHACLSRLARNTAAACITSPAPEEEELPLTNTLMAEPIGLRFFDYHHSVALKGVTRFFKNVAQILFDEEVMAAAAGDANHPAARRLLSSGLHIWQPFCSHGVWPEPTAFDPSPQPALRPSSSASLNPMARPWSPWTDPSPDDQRSMFITFSRGYPLSRDDIKDFFNKRFEQLCVEMVMIERVPEGEMPMYGRVVFTCASAIVLVLNGQRTAKFMIKGRHLWARMYVPRGHAPIN